MATNEENSRNLTGPHFVHLGRVISCASIESIALEHLNINIERTKQLRESRREDPQGFVRDVIQDWACRHPVNQVQVRITVGHLL